MGGATISTAVTTRVFLTFPRRLVSEHVLFEMGASFAVRTNIRGASITSDVALIALELTGDAHEVERAVSHLTELGVGVERMS